MIPFTPQDLASLQSRYPAARAEVFDSESVHLGTQVNPGDSPRQWFDCHDGLRLLISRVVEPGLHSLGVSATIAAGSELDQATLEGRLHLSQFITVALARYRLISGDQSEYDEFGLLPDFDIPMWIWRLGRAS